VTFTWPAEKVKAKPLIPGFEGAVLLAALALLPLVRMRKARKA